MTKSVWRILCLSLVLLNVFSGRVMAQAPRAAAAVATVVNGFVVSITVTDGGFGYMTPPEVRLIDLNGTGASAAATILNGVVTRVVVTDAGSGYSTSPKVVISSPPSNRPATATATVVNGFVVSVNVTDGGSGYATPPSVSISGGSGAITVAQISNGAVTQIVVVDAGTGYPANPVVRIAPPPLNPSPFSGLVAYYPFNGNANDESGNGNHGWVGGATLTTDRFGIQDSAYHFNGIDNYISVPDAPANDLADQFTISFWFEANPGYGSPQNGNIVLIAKWGYLVPGQASFGIDLTEEGRLRVVTSDGLASLSWTQATAPNVVPPRTWHSVMFIKDASTFSLYEDDTPVLTTTTLQQPQRSNSNLSFGREETLNYAFYSGKLDDIRIYNRALSDEERSTLYRLESSQGPWLSIRFKTVQVTMHVTPANKYQLQASFDAITWVNVEAPFLATSHEILREFDAIQVGRFFRLLQL